MLDEPVRTYFETYLGGSLSALRPGQILVCACERRKAKEEGWGLPFTIWAFVVRDRAIVSVRPDLRDIVARITHGLKGPRELLQQSFREAVGSACDVPFRSWDIDILSCGADGVRLHPCPSCRQMQEDDVGAYLAFKKTVAPNCDAACCRRDILRNIRDGIAYAVFDGPKLVSESSAPHIGFMQDQIEEPGIDTLEAYRRRGYGKSTLSHTTKAIFGLGRVPVYRLSKANVPSLRTATAVGYKRVAEAVRFAEAHVN
jgi:hypothetical protein